MRFPVEIPPGVIVDDTTFATGQSAWSDMDKVRFWRGQPQVIGGWERLVTTALTGVCRTALPWTDNSGALNVAFGTNSNLEVWLNGELYDITPVSDFTPGLVDGTGGSGYGTGTYSTGTYSSPAEGSFFPLTWALDTYGQNLMGNPRGQTIFQWTNNTGTPAAPVTNAPAEVTFMVVTNTRQVMALGCNQEEDGVFNPRCIRWTDFENPTQWTTLITNAAGEFILEGSGLIVAARIIGENVFVWTDNALYQGYYDPTNGWLFPQVGENCGLIGPNAAVVVASQSAFWFGSNGQFWGCVLGGVPQIVTCPMQGDVFGNIAASQTSKIVVSACAQYGEVRMDYPDARDGTENSRYIVYSMGSNRTIAQSYSTLNTVWAKGTMVRTAYVDAGPSPSPIAVDVTGDIYYHERGQSADGSAFDAFIESADFYTGSAETIMEIRGMWPDVQNQIGTLNLSLIMQLYPQDPNLRTKGPYPLSPGQSKKDFLASGRIARIRYESNSAPTFWRLGQPVYDAIEAGLR